MFSNLLASCYFIKISKNLSFCFIPNYVETLHINKTESKKIELLVLVNFNQLRFEVMKWPSLLTRSVLEFWSGRNLQLSSSSGRTDSIPVEINKLLNCLPLYKMFHIIV